MTRSTSGSTSRTMLEGLSGIDTDWRSRSSSVSVAAVNALRPV
jgi:hypothetical protein